MVFYSCCVILGEVMFFVNVVVGLLYIYFLRLINGKVVFFSCLLSWFLFFVLDIGFDFFIDISIK